MKISTFPTIKQNAQMFTSLISKLNMDAEVRDMVDALQSDSVSHLKHVLRSHTGRAAQCTIDCPAEVAVGHFAMAILNQILVTNL